MRRYLVAVILIAQLNAGLFAQQPRTAITEPPPPPPQEPKTQPQKPEDVDVVRITTNLVQVDAVVTDKSGKVVTDLKPEEVQISEDGKPQKITHFSYNVTESGVGAAPAKPASVDKNAPPVPPVALRPEQVRRAMAIVVDDLGLSFESTHFVRQALKKFVDEQMQPGDLVAIVRTSGGMGALQQFTSDKRQLYAAIERVKWYASGRAGVSAFAPIESQLPGSSSPGADNTTDTNATDELNQFREDIYAVGTLGALSYVIRGLRELPGRKSILLLSDGIKVFNRDDPSKSDRVQQALFRLTDQANRASVVIYTMDARGLQTLGLTAADDVSGMNADQVQTQISNRRADFLEGQNGLNYLAQQTGGIAIRNTNDLARGVKRVLEDQRGYYLIGYRPDQSTFDPKTGRRRFHHLSLKVTRPGKFNVRMRNGFFGVSDEGVRSAPRTLAQQLISALSSPFGATGVHLQLTSLFGNDVKVGSFMRSILHIDARDLTFTDEPNGWHKTVFDVLSITFGDNGVPVDQNGRTYTLKLPDELYKRALRDGLVYSVVVPIKKPGAYQLRMSLRDSSTEAVGAASQFIDAPDLKKDRLALSGIVLSGEAPTAKSSSPNAPAGRAGASPPTSSAPGETQEGVEQGNAEASPAVRHFGRGMQMSYGFVIYNAHLDKTTNAPQLTTQVRLFRDGKPVFTGKENPFKSANTSDLKRLLAGGVIQLGTDLPPGEYVFQVIVNDPLASEKHRVASQWIDFEIAK
jgi:VWFA-related protein